MLAWSFSQVTHSYISVYFKRPYKGSAAPEVKRKKPGHTISLTLLWLSHGEEPTHFLGRINLPLANSLFLPKILGAIESYTVQPSWRRRRIVRQASLKAYNQNKQSKSLHSHINLGLWTLQTNAKSELMFLWNSVSQTWFWPMSPIWKPWAVWCCISDIHVPHSHVDSHRYLVMELKSMLDKAKTLQPTPHLPESQC